MADARAWLQIGLMLLTWSLVDTALTADNLRPFVAVPSTGSTLEEVVAGVKHKLEAGGIEILGQYAPYADDSAVIIGATTPELLAAAGARPYAGFGAVMRVAVTNNKGRLEVSYTNPVYMGYAYRIGDLSTVGAQFASALGIGEPFGARGLTPAELEEYHYNLRRPYFKARQFITHFDSHEEGVTKTRAALRHPAADMGFLWEVRISPTQTLFGVDLRGGKWQGRMKRIMDKIDIATPRSTASLPWELLVNDRELVYLPGRFRIAVMFPDLTMIGFMTIAEVPDNMDESAAGLAKLIEGMR